jgi:cobalt-zinc-cadmium resistance protein CzcA
MINGIIRHALERRPLTILVVVLVAVWGTIVYQRLPKDLYPDLNAPLVNIVTENPGMASEDVERLISFPLESLLAGAPGVTRVRSESTTGDSVVTVEFDWGTDIYQARQIVASKLELIAGRLPIGTSPPILGPVSSRMGEVFEFAVVGDGVDPMELRSVADWTIRYRLQGVPGVSFVINLGGFVKQFHVHLRPEMLAHHDITVADVEEAIESGNRNFSGGVLRLGAQEALIKGVGRLESLEHIRDTVITSRHNVPVRVGDVADVHVGGHFRREAASYNGDEAVCVTTEKQYGGDTLGMIANVKEALAEIGRHLPDSIRIVTFYDESRLIESALQHVEFSMLLGALLIVAVMLAFMGDLRSALIASLTIPFSVLIALILMDLFGVALTVMSMGGLAIAIGKMANGSIIMVENVARVLDEKGQEAPVRETVLAAAGEVGGLLFSATLIILLVFLPLLSLGGIEGAMFRPTAFAVAAGLFGALLLNLTLQPALASLLLGGRPVRSSALCERLTTIYRRLVVRALGHRRAVIVVFAVMVAGAAIGFGWLGTEFVPPLDEGAILASTVMLPETSLEESVQMGRRVEALIQELPEVVSVSRTTGSAESSEHVHPVNHSHYHIELLPRERRRRGFAEIAEDLRARLERLPGVAVIFEQPIANRLAEMLTGTEGQLAIKLFGTDLGLLNRKIEEIHQVVSGIPGAADLQVEQTAGIPQLVVRLDRHALGRHGLSVSQVADIVETALNGIVATDVYELDRVTPVVIRLPDEYRESEDAVGRLLISAPSGERIPLSQLAQISRGEGPQTILREDLMRRKVIVGNVSGRDVGGFVREAAARIQDEVELPSGYFVRFGGQFESQQRALRHLSVLMAVVLLVIFVVLLTSFGSVWQALLVVLNMPSTLVGGVVGLLLCGETLNVSSTIGLIALLGICAQNDIILVGKINDLRRAGRSLREAVLEGATLKFRPIFVTDLVMIAGVLPLALSHSTGAELHRPLAVVYIGGFFFAVLLRLFVVPVLYETLGTWAARRS